MFTERQLDDLREKIRPLIPESRYRHTLGVEKEVRYLASIYLPENEDLCAAAALLHDVTKGIKTADQPEYCVKNGIIPDADATRSPAILHAQTAVHYIGVHFPEFAAPELLQAVRLHTTGDGRMTVADMLLFIADFTEEGRVYDSCVAARKALHAGPEDGEDKIAFLRRIFVLVCDGVLAELLRRSSPIALRTVAARNAALAGEIPCVCDDKDSH